jgi:hypothetical protein
MVEGIAAIIIAGVIGFRVWSHYNNKKEKKKIEDNQQAYQNYSYTNTYENEKSHKQIQQENIKQIRGINFQKFEKVKYVSKERDYFSDLEELMKLGITPHIFIESLMTVHLEGRKASCCFSDQINFQSSIEQLELIAKKIKEDYNIFMDAIAIPFGKGCMILFFFFKDIKEYKRIEKLQEISESQTLPIEETFKNTKLVKLWGDILDYPKCCVDFCVKTRKDNKEIETECSEMLKSILEYKKVDKNKVKEDKKELSIPEKVLTNYFAYEFYPCNPNCKEAKIIGDDIKKRFSKEDKTLATAFQINSEFNSRKVLNPSTDPKMGKFQNMMKDRIIHRLFSVYNESKKLKTN